MFKLINLNMEAEPRMNMLSFIKLYGAFQIHTKFTYHHSPYHKTETLVFSEN